MIWLAIDGGPAENRHRTRGIGTFVRALISSLGHEGVDPGVKYLACHPIADLRDRWQERSRATRLAGVDARVSDRASLAFQLLDAAWILPREMRRTGARVFLATDPHAIPLDGSIATVAMVYDFIPLVFPEHYLRGVRATLRRIAFAESMRRLRRSAGLIAISGATRDDALRFLGADSSMVAVVPLAVDHAVFHPQAAEGRAAPIGGAPYLLYVGEADARKNVGALIEAFTGLANVDLHLVLAGGSARTRNLLARAIGTGSAGRIHLVGPCDVHSLASLYAGALAFVFPSMYEGFGLPVLEAMACGAPVICSPTRALVEVAGAAALLTEPTPDAIRVAITRLAHESSLRQDLRGEGLERAAAFTWERTRDGILDACWRWRQ